MRYFERRERNLVWFGGFAGAILSSLLNLIVSIFSVAKLPLLVIPFATLAVWFAVFLIVSYPVVVFPAWLADRMGFLK